MMEKFKVKFLPGNKTVEVTKDTSILDAAISAGIYLKSSCGGDGVCGHCKVALRKGNILSQPTGLLSSEDKEKNMHLACMSLVQSDIEVEVPSESMLDFGKSIPKELKDAYAQVEEIEPLIKEPAQEKEFKFSPLIEKLYLELPPPDLNDKISDLERLDRQIAVPTKTNLATIQTLSPFLRDAEWKITLTVGKLYDGTREKIRIESGNTVQRNFAFCFDIGTTTISGQLIDLNSGKILGTKIAYNKQASFGSDVITRIIYASKPEGLEDLHAAVVEVINQIIRELTYEHSIGLNDVSAIVCSGNTTMVQILLGIDPKHIRKEPYVPTANFLPVVRAHERGINIGSHGLLYCAPSVSSYVGGDAVAGVLSSGIYKERELSILIDIGTNGEIVLGNRDFLISCAASAGPAFEGSGLSCGMRASHGAIQRISVEPKTLEVKYSAIADEPPRGICGSGYIELLAQMLDAGVIDKNGKIKIDGHTRISTGESGKEFLLVQKKYANSTQDIFISEADIENLKRAKAAIYSAASILAKHMDLGLSDIKKFFIAGGFGTSLNIESAIKIGLLPDLEREKFIFIGNSSLTGTREMLLSFDAAKFISELARKITYFELSIDPSYMEEYIAALFFPHTDLSKFPSIKI